MKASLREISESEFKKLELKVLFNDESTDRVFGVVSDGKNEYKLGWQSTDIKPVIKWINTVLCSIGIDLTFVIFEFKTGRILQKLSLDYFFYDASIFNEFLYVTTQLEVIKINIFDVTVVETYALPDYFENIEVKDGNIFVKCSNGDVVKIE